MDEESAAGLLELAERLSQGNMGEDARDSLEQLEARSEELTAAKWTAQDFALIVPSRGCRVCRDQNHILDKPEGNDGDAQFDRSSPEATGLTHFYVSHAASSIMGSDLTRSRTLHPVQNVGTVRLERFET